MHICWACSKVTQLSAQPGKREVAVVGMIGPWGAAIVLCCSAALLVYGTGLNRLRSCLHVSTVVSVQFRLGLKDRDGRSCES